jgi:arginase
MSVLMRMVELIGAAIGEGAPDGRTRAGPAALRRWGLGRRLSDRGRSVRWGPEVASDQALTAHGPLAVVAEFSDRLASRVAESIGAGRLPVVIGGDHSCAVGTWSGAARALRQRSADAWNAPRGRTLPRLGLVWIDAHLDAHTPQTSESQMPHGMPLASLLGHGSAQLTHVAGHSPALRPADVVLIGCRSWESGEAALLQRLGVRVIVRDEVARRGFAVCMAEAVAQVSDGTAAWGVSLDLDALDPADAPGTGTPVERGLRLDEVSEVLHGLAWDPRLLACELVEYNPELDPQRITAQATERLLGALIDPRSRGAAEARAMQDVRAVAPQKL